MQGFDCRQGQKLDSFAEHPRLASTPDNPLLAKLALPSCDSLFTGPALAPLRELSSVDSILKGSFFLGSRWKQGHSRGQRSEEHTSELQSLMRISYAVFCLKKKNNKKNRHTNQH